MCELDIIFNFEKAYFMLDELLLGGEIQETSKKNVLKAIAAQDLLQEVVKQISAFQYYFWVANESLSWTLIALLPTNYLTHSLIIVSLVLGSFILLTFCTSLKLTV